MDENPIEKLAELTGGVINEVTLLPGGSGFATMSMPLPENHWIYGDPSVENHGEDWSYEPAPMPMRMGTDNPERERFAQMLIAAGRYAVRAATMKGKDPDFDPDALIQNLVIGFLGYQTPDGLSNLDDWANPTELTGVHSVEQTGDRPD